MNNAQKPWDATKECSKYLEQLPSYPAQLCEEIIVIYPAHPRKAQV